MGSTFHRGYQLVEQNARASYYCIAVVFYMLQMDHDQILFQGNLTAVGNIIRNSSILTIAINRFEILLFESILPRKALPIQQK